LDHAGLKSLDRSRVSDPDRDAGDADSGPLFRFSFLHQRSRRQRDDVHEPDLGMGSSGGLYSGPAGVRDLLGSGLDVLQQVAVPPADFLLHNSLFLVAHFHNVIIGGVLFGAFAGLTYWFPKAFGFRLHEGLGKAAFWFSLIGFYVTFMPLYAAGLLGMTRRMQHYDVPAWRPWMIAAAIGFVLLTIGIVFQVLQIIVSILRREELRDRTGDPWDGRSLEWATSSPPPVFNFAILPDVHGEEAYWAIKSRAKQQDLEKNEPHYEDIEMPRNSPTGFVCAFFATVMGFAL